MKKYNLLKDVLTVVVCLMFAYIVGVNTMHEGELLKVFLGKAIYATHADVMNHVYLYMYNTMFLLFWCWMGRKVVRENRKFNELAKIRAKRVPIMPYYTPKNTCPFDVAIRAQYLAQAKY